MLSFAAAFQTNTTYIYQVEVLPAEANKLLQSHCARLTWMQA